MIWLFAFTHTAPPGDDNNNDHFRVEVHEEQIVLAVICPSVIGCLFAVNSDHPSELKFPLIE